MSTTGQDQPRKVELQLKKLQLKRNYFNNYSGNRTTLSGIIVVVALY